MFDVNRTYKKLRDRMNSERIDDYIEFLPGDVVSAAPVSYTHLDVYKRQIQGHYLIFLISCFRVW